MSDPETGRPIVAELGRPETAEETWARKDTARRARREHQTAFNLVLALIASLGIVLFLVAVVVRPDQAVDRSVDYRQVAQQADVSGAELLVPDLPSSYTSNNAEYQSGSARGVAVWTIGLLTPDEQYIGMHQGIDANDTWVADQLDQKSATGSRTIAGTKWTVYDRRDEGKAAGNNAYALVTTSGKDTVVLAGTADQKSFTTVATAVGKELDR
ncbi:DUF4245 domain-containing protein [Curtobacterium herbarum]|uniref:DUF4245 domain-containing protein n=1 Tax=Curtobacterium herbarum TaxID=150122 RepID=A0ABP4JZW2_9MICO|nr:DUF4245 domain-containing protein [Curtobacterium herbarum]MBM7476282.1 hypothetical protein [Curtobacterium herbarum]MCS6544151.1 DUF4245 domain-containing protein [Curtobacterium herbarum]